MFNIGKVFTETVTGAWSGVSRRMLQLMLKQAFGRFTKEISKDHVLDPKWTGTGVEFETHMLEIDEKVVNAEVLEGTPLRLVRGQINGLRGEASVSLTAPRNFEVESLDLTFDVLGTLSKRSAGSEDEVRQRGTSKSDSPPRKRASSLGSGSNSGASGGEDLWSSMLKGDVAREIIERDVLEQDNASDEAIDTGVSAVSSTIKMLICSIDGHVNEIIVRFRIPPPGTEIVPGASLPLMTTEVFLHLPKGVHVLDETDSAALGNSFQKRVKFGGLVAQVYAANEQKHSDDDHSHVQHLSYSNTVCSGQMDEVENELTVAFNDMQAGGQDNSWKFALSIHHLHMLMSPMQLSRLVRVANFFLRAPDVEDVPLGNTMTSSSVNDASQKTDSNNNRTQNNAAAKEAPPSTNFSFSVSLADVSCTLLERESREVGECWRRFYQKQLTTPTEGLTESHFGLRLQQLRARVMKPPPHSNAANAKDDPYFALFDRYGGVHIQIGLKDIEIVEQVMPLPGKLPRPPATILRLRKLGRKEGSQIAASVRTTCPLTPSLAAEYGVDFKPDLNGPKNVARQDISVFAFAAVEVFVDVETLQRILRFHHVVYSTVYPETIVGKDSFLDLAELDNLHGFDEDTMGMTPPRQTSSGQHTIHAAPRQPKFDADDDAEEYTMLRTVSVNTEMLWFEIRFLRDHRPSPDFYGPVSQRLFQELVALSSPESQFLNKSLAFQVSSLHVSCPKGDSSDILAAIGLAQCFLVDLQTDEKAELCCINFNGPQTKDAGPLNALAKPSLRMKMSDTGTAVRPPTKHFSPDEADKSTIAKENDIAKKCTNSIGLRAHSVTVALHQDDLLLLLFMIDQILECTNAALEEAARDLSAAAGFDVAPAIPGGMFYSAESSQSLRASHMKSQVMGVEASTSIQVQIGYAQMQVFAPRLAPSGGAVGDPIWMTRSKEERAKYNHDLAFHSYVLEFVGTEVFVLSLSNSTVSSLNVNVRMDGVDLHERLPHLPPMSNFTPPAHDGCTPAWGELVPLLRSYAQLYNRSHDTKASAERKALRVCISRLTDMTKRSQTLEGDVAIDRLSVMHQPAHEGDHWLFVLIGFFSDSPMENINAKPATNGEDSDDSNDDAGSAVDIVPLSCTTHIRVGARDTLLQYRPFGREMMMAALCPQLRVDTGRMLSASPRVVMTISLDKLSLFLHDHFTQDLLRYDDIEGTSSVFGNSRKGIAADLELIGFVSVASIASSHLADPNIAIHMQDVEGKPLFVDISNLKGEISAANDSFYMLQLGISHFLGGLDHAHIPAPHHLIGANGEECVKIWPPQLPTAGPEVKVLVENIQSRITELLSQKLKDVCPIVPDATPGGDSFPRGSFATPPAPNASFAAGATNKLPAKPRYFDSLRGVEGDVPPSLMHPSHPQRKSTPPPADDDGFDVLDDFEFVDLGPSSRTKRTAKWELHEDGKAVNYNPLPRGPEDVGASNPPLVTREGSTFNLNNLFTDPQHLSLHGKEHIARSKTATSAVKLSNCPPIASEVVMHNCDFVLKLYGGTDLGGTGVHVSREAAEFTTMPTFHEAFKEQVGGAADGMYRNARSTTELIIAKLHDIYVQADTFDEGHNKAMHLLVTIRDVEVIDRIEGSPVKSILMCSVPRESRDNDGFMFEMKWITILPQSLGGGKHPEEQMSVRLQPIAVALHRRAVDLLMKFVNSPDVETEPSTMFFNKLYIHPLTLTFYFYPEAQDVSAAVTGDVYEVANMFPSSLEGSRVSTAPIVMLNFAVEELGPKLGEILANQYGLLDVLLLFCRIEVIRTVAEGGQAVAELVLTPIDYYKRNKGLYAGVAKGFTNFSRRVGAEAARVAATATRTASTGLHYATSSVQGPRDAPLSRGNQARSAGEGLTRAVHEVGSGLTGAATAVTLCFNSEGSLLKLPLVALMPVNGVLRGVTHALLGLRNTIRPENRALETNLFKK